jgi:hypothetical protein
MRRHPQALHSTQLAMTSVHKRTAEAGLLASCFRFDSALLTAILLPFISPNTQLTLVYLRCPVPPDNLALAVRFSARTRTKDTIDTEANIK